VVKAYKGLFIVLASSFALLFFSSGGYSYPEYCPGGTADCTECHVSLCDQCPSDPRCVTTTWTITASVSGTGGSILPVGAVSVVEGTNQQFLITPSSGYEILDVVVDGGSVGAVPSYTFPNVTADHTIEASFVLLPVYTIDASAGLGGFITPSGAVQVIEGNDQQFSIAADPGYDVSDVVADGVSQGPVPFHTFANVTADHTIVAYFAESAFPYASFIVDPVSGSAGAPVAVQFTDTSTGGPTSWLWEFGYGLTSTEQNPMVAFYVPGIYPVTLTVANGAGQDSRSQDYLVYECANQLAMLQSDGSQYDTVMEAYDAAAASGLDDTIMLKGGFFNEDLNFYGNASVGLMGGFDCSLADDLMLTSISGSMTILGGTAGKATVSNIVISSMPPAEVCDGLDNDNDGLTDEDLIAPPCTPQQGVCAGAVQVCLGASGWSGTNSPQCYGPGYEVTEATCDGLDNDCDGQVDEGLSFDADGDGHTSLTSCSGTKDDCDDGDPANFPGNAEICDGADNDCDFIADNGLTFDVDTDGYSSPNSCAGSRADCNDGDGAVHPGATEICGDGIDQDCDGYDPPCASTCTTCHASAQPSGYLYRRQIVGPGGDFGGGSHHVSDGTETQIVTSSDCEVCHDQSQHMTNLDPPVLLKDPDGGSAITYTGQGYSLEPFCLGCHDADSAGTQPFSDGQNPADIETNWAGSSHDTGLSQEACMSCHGGSDPTRTGLAYDQNAHGSSFRPSLLSTTVAGEAVSDRQESLCFACHDSDGPAATDIEATFMAMETMTSASGALLNSNHDVLPWSQAYSGAVITCSDCHDPHGARPADIVVSDPDPNDGRTPTAGTSYTGSSYQSEWCLDCHDNSFPASVTPPGHPMVDIYNEWIDPRGAQHGSGDASKNVNLREGSGYSRYDILNCEVCHVSGHGVGTGHTNLAQLRTVIYSKDGTTPLMPDQSWDITNPYIVRVLNTDAANTDATTNGKAWCSTCHPNPMGGNKDSGCLAGNCHAHGEGAF